MLTRSELTPPLLFLLLCIPARIGLFLLTTRAPEAYVPALGTLFAGIGLSFLYLFASNSRLDAPEAGGKGTWWHSLRPVHGLLFLSAGLLLLSGKPRRYAAACLGTDVLIGLGAHVSKYWFT